MRNTKVPARVGDGVRVEAESQFEHGSVKNSEGAKVHRMSVSRPGYGSASSDPHERGEVPPDDESQNVVGRPAFTPSVSHLCVALIELQVRRKYCISLANKQTNAAGALARRYLGFKWDDDEKAREGVAKQAARIVSNFLNGKEPHEDDIAAFSKMADLDVTAAALVPLEKRRHEIELQMARLVRKLPVAAWAKSVRGLGEIGLAVIIGESGDLSGYAHERKLWKRLGLAPVDGQACSQWRVKGGLSAEGWIAAGYAPRRRAEIHACVGEPLFRAQSASTTNPAAGPYRQAYDARRAHCDVAHPDWPKGHLHGDALRIMTKKLIADLWSSWRGSTDCLEANKSVARANFTQPEASDQLSA